MSDILAHVEIIPADAGHLPWIASTFSHQMRSVPLTTRRQAADLSGALARIVRGKLGQTAIACPANEHDAGMGWAASLDGALLFAYVSEEFRRQGIGAALIATVTRAAPVQVAVWTESAEEMTAAGFPVVYDIRAFRALCSYVRRSYHQTEKQVRAAG